MDYTDQPGNRQTGGRGRESDGQARGGDAGGRREEGGKQEEDETSEEGSSNRTQPKIINGRKTRPQRPKRGRGRGAPHAGVQPSG